MVSMGRADRERWRRAVQPNVLVEPVPAMANLLRAALGIVAFVALASPAGSCDADEPPAADAPQLDTFAQRRRAMLDAAWDDYRRNPAKPSWKNAFLVAGALFELGKIDEGRRMANFGLDGLEPGNRINRWYLGGNSGFTVWPGIDCYIRYEHLLDDALKERFKKIYTSGVFYRRFTTSNHVAMAGVTRYLAVQTWGRDAFHPHPLYADKVYEALSPEAKKATRWPPSQLFSNDDPDAEKLVWDLVNRVAKQGPGEYASRPYGAENTLPLLTLAECAKDPELRRRARIAYELTLLQLAPAYLRGHLATFSPRSYPDMESQRPWGIASLTWLAFGGVPPANPGREWALRAATSAYELPAAALAVGSDRSRAYSHRCLFGGWALSHHVTPHYVVFARSPKNALERKQRYPFQGQSYPCGIMWDEPDVSRSSQLWVTCPAADDNTNPKNAPSGLHTHGVTPHEQEVLHENALLWVFDIPKDFRNPYVLGFVPGGHRAHVNDAASAGRIYLHFGSVLVAITASHPFAWDPDGGIRAPAGKPPQGSSEFRIERLDCAVALEAAAPAEFPGATPAEQLAAFKGKLLATTKIELRAGETPTGIYTDRHGHVLDCTFNGPDRIDGKPLDYVGWPIIENPWMTQTDPDRLVLTAGGVRRTYDFTTWTVTESPVEPVTKTAPATP
jgi:hypothetical protein